MGVLEEYKAKMAEFEAKAEELKLSTAKRDEVKAAFDGLRKKRLDEFMAGFAIISQKLKEMYQVGLVYS